MQFYYRISNIRQTQDIFNSQMVYFILRNYLLTLNYQQTQQNLELKWVKNGVESGAKIDKSWTKSWSYHFYSKFQFNIDFLENIIRFENTMFKCFIS